MIKCTQILYHSAIRATTLSEADKLQFTVEIPINVRIADQFVQLEAHLTLHALRL